MGPKNVVVKVKKPTPFKKRASGLLTADPIYNFTAAVVSTPPKSKAVSVSTPDVVWVPMPLKFRALQTVGVVPVVDLPELPETILFQRNIMAILTEPDAPPEVLTTETDEEIRARILQSKLRYIRNNWFADRGSKVDVDGGDPPDGESEETGFFGFSYFPLALLPETDREDSAADKDGPPCADSCECFVGYDGSTGHNGLCYCTAVGTCVRCDDNVFYCPRCVNHTTHTRIAEDVAWSMTDDN
jgi:hypothetical protein